MRAVIIYDELNLAAMANVLLVSAGQQSVENAHWNVVPWRVDILENSPAASVSLGEAMNAHLIVLALRPARRLPGRLMEWLESWATRRQVQDAALAIFKCRDQSRDGLTSSVTCELSGFAQRHGLAFIFDDGDTVEESSTFSFWRLHEREQTLTLSVRDIVDRSMNGSHRNLGISD